MRNNPQQNNQNSNQNSLVNVRPPWPISLASYAKGKARPPDDFNGSPDDNAENWI